MFGRTRKEISVACLVLAGVLGLGSVAAFGQSSADFWIEEAARRARQVLPAVPAMPSLPRESSSGGWGSGWSTGSGSWNNGGWGSGRSQAAAPARGGFRVLTVPSLRSHERIRPAETAGPTRARPGSRFASVPSSGGGGGSGGAVCVRMCDGAFFPASSAGSGMSDEEACSSLCPGTATRVYYLKDGADKGIEGAVSAQSGMTYESLPVAYRYLHGHDATCSCKGGGQNFSTGHLANFLNDKTLRSGDSVMTTTGIRVFRGGAHFPWRESDFVALAKERGLARGDRQRLVAIERASLRYGPAPVLASAEDATATTEPGRRGHRRHHRRH